MDLKLLENEVYAIHDLKITDLVVEKEGKEYEASRFCIQGKQMIFRKAKITPKKIGFFVTLWKRNSQGITTPFSITDSFENVIILAHTAHRTGHFVIPKSVLADKGIIRTSKENGKRGFRVYPPWEFCTNKQATRSQQWQCLYFIETTNGTTTKAILKIYQLNNSLT